MIAPVGRIMPGTGRSIMAARESLGRPVISGATPRPSVVRTPKASSVDDVAQYTPGGAVTSETASKGGMGMTAPLVAGGAAAAGAAYGLSKGHTDADSHPILRAADRVAGIAGSAAGVASMTMMLPMLVFPTKGIAGIGKITKLNGVEKLGNGLTTAFDRLGSITNAEVLGKISSKGGKALSDSAAKAASQGKQGWGNLSAIHTVAHVGFATQSGIGLYSAGGEFIRLLDGLKQMHADIEGKDVSQVSTGAVLFGHVSKPVAEARKILLMKDGIHAATHTFGLGINLKALKRPDAFSGILGMAAWMLPDMIDQGINSYLGDSVLPYYEQMSKAHKAGEAIPPQAYAELLMIASEDLKARGSTGHQFAEKLAEQYAAEKLSPAQVMVEISGGAMKKRIDVITAQHTSEGVSYVRRLQEGGAAKAGPVIGEHTKRIAGKNLEAMETPSQTRH